MSIRRSVVLLVGLLSLLISLSEGKLRWKCELFDTSQETSTRTTFVEYLHNKSPEPSIPKSPSRVPRSTGKCRPRPKNGTIPVDIPIEKMKTKKRKEVDEEDVPQSAPIEGTEDPHVRYQRKQEKHSNDLNIGPGFEESNDPYGRNRQPMPKRFRPAELKGADELSKPLQEHLDENVMPDFEFDEEENPPIDNDLPWCPEEPEDLEDCDSIDISKLKIHQLLELQAKCEGSATPERMKLIKKLIILEKNSGIEPTTDRTVALPPTGTSNCSTIPSSSEDFQKFQKECPCENSTAKMSPEEFEKFKDECLEVLKIPGRPLVRKNSRCTVAKRITDGMSEVEYAKFVEECLVKPKISLQKILEVVKSPECQRKSKNLKKEPKNFEKFRKSCIKTIGCDEIDRSTLTGASLEQFRRLCTTKIRKTFNICDTEDVESLDDVKFEEFRRKCILNRCEDVEVEKLTPSELKKYQEDCEDWNSPPEVPKDCQDMEILEMNRKEYLAYKKRCPSKSTSSIDCTDLLRQNGSASSSSELTELLIECSTLPNCKKIKEMAENSEKWRKECKKTKELCDDVNKTSEEYRQFCLSNPQKSINCSSLTPSDVSNPKIQKTFKKTCIRDLSTCRDIDISLLNSEEFQEFQKKCLKTPKTDCDSIEYPEELSVEEYKKYKEDCLEDSEDVEEDCSTQNPQKMSPQEFKKFQKTCLQMRSDCQDVNVKELDNVEYEKFFRRCRKSPEDSEDCSSQNPKKMSRREYEEFQKTCVKRTSECLDVDVNDISDQEYEKYLKNCLKSPEDHENDEDCSSQNPQKMSSSEYQKFQKTCLQKTSDCQDVNVNDLSDEEYEKFIKKCLKSPEDSEDCDDLNPDDLTGQELIQYKQQCSKAPGNDFDCDDVNPKNLTKKQLKKFQKKCLQKTSDCQDVDVKELDDVEYEKFFRRCRKSPEDLENCTTQNPQKMSPSEFKKFQKTCLKKISRCQEIDVNTLNSTDLQEFLKKCVKTPECVDIDTDGMTKERYLKYVEECEEDLWDEEDCEEKDVKKMSPEELREFQKTCLQMTSDCQDVNVNDLSDEEYEKLQKKCLKTPENCEDVNPKTLTQKQLKKFQKRCLQKTSDCQDVDVKELDDVEYEKFFRRCRKSPEDSEDCSSQNPKKMSRREYEEFQKTCVKRTSECLDVDVNDLSDEEYEKYLKNCVKSPEDQEDCSSQNPQKMSRREFLKFQKTCFKSTSDCQNANVYELTGEEYREYEEKCLKGHLETTDCSTVNPKKLTRKQMKTYEKTCLERKTFEEDDEDCEEKDVKKMSPSEFKKFQKTCLQKTSDCQDVIVNDLSDEEYLKFQKKCLKTTENCDDVNPKNLTQKQLKKFQKKCLQKTSDCQDVDVTELDDVEYEKFFRRCRKSPQDCSSQNPQKMSPSEFKKFQKTCLQKTSDCQDVNVNDLSFVEYDEFIRRCRKTSDCDDVDVDRLTDRQYTAYLTDCNVTFNGTDCEDVTPSELSDDELLEYLKTCGMYCGIQMKEKATLTEKQKTWYQKTCEGDEKELEKKTCEEIDVERIGENLYPAYAEKCNPDKIDVCSLLKNSRKLTRKSFKKIQLKCSPRKTPSSPSGGPGGPEDLEDCNGKIEFSDVSKSEYIRHVSRCSPPFDRTSSCSRINVTGEMSDVEFRKFQKTCLTPSKERTSPPGGTSPKNCSSEDVAKMTASEYREFKRRCEKPTREGCEDVRIEELTADEYQAYKKRCLEGPRDSECSNVDVQKMSASEYREFKIRCKKTTSSENCEDVDTSRMSEDERRRHQKRCGESVKIVKTLVIHKNPNGGPDDVKTTVTKTVDGSEDVTCSNVNLAKLTDRQYSEYRKKCKPSRKTSGCSDDVDLQKMSEEEQEEYRRRCGPSSSEDEDDEDVTCKEVDVFNLSKAEYVKYRRRCPVNTSPECEDVVIEKLSDEEFRKFLKTCGRRCADVDIESLSSEEYVEFKRRCDHDSEGPEDVKCSRIKVEELSPEEFDAYQKRCNKTKTWRPDDVNCSRIDKKTLSREELQKFRRRCPETQKTLQVEGDKDRRRAPHIELTKIVKISGSDECEDVDINSLSSEDLEAFRRRCGEFRKTFQFNCNADVSKMSDDEFRRFRKACARKPSEEEDCDDVDTNQMTSQEYDDFLKRCGVRTDCSKNRKIEKMSAKEYSEYKKACKTRKTSSEGCEDVNVEDLTSSEYQRYKQRCLLRTTTSSPEPKRIRINCSIVDVSRMAPEELADFRKHCQVKVRTDGFRPGENMILEKEVRIRTGKEEFSCYDQDVDRMTEEEYSEFQRRCLKHPHFRYDCSTVDTSRMDREQYTKYQRECPTSSPSQKKVELIKELKIYKPNGKIEDGCYNVDVERMSDSEYSEYEVRCLGKERRRERKTSNIDCHNVDLSKLSFSEIEEHLRRCRTRETASTPSSPRRRQSLRCADVITDDLDDVAYSKWVRECQETSPKNITLRKELEIQKTPEKTPGESVKIEKLEIRKKIQNPDDVGSYEGNEDYHVRVTKTLKKVIRRRDGEPDDVDDDETGVILVRKTIHQLPRRRRPDDVDTPDESGVIEVKKLIMKTSRPSEPDDDSEDVVEIMRRPRRKVGPKEEVVLLSVVKHAGRRYTTKKIEEEEPEEVVKLKKNVINPDKILKEIRIHRNIGRRPDDVEDTVIQEIGGPDFRITRKTVMHPRRIRKLRSTTTTTTTPSEPEYYYEEEEIPEVVTMVKVDKSVRPLRKTFHPEDVEYEDVQEEQPESYVEFEGFVKVHQNPRRLQSRRQLVDSQEEPEIREVTRKIAGSEDVDDFKGVKLRAHRKLLRKSSRRREAPEDVEHETIVVKRLKTLEFERPREFTEEEGVGEDGRVVVKHRRKTFEGRRRPDDVDEDVESDEVVEGRVAVRGRAPKTFRRRETPEITEENSQFRKIGGEDVKKSRKRGLEESEEDDVRVRRRPANSEDEDEDVTKRRRIQKTSDGESVTLVKKKKIIVPSAPEDVDEDENEEIRLRRKKMTLPFRRRDVSEEDGEVVKVVKKKTLKYGPNGEKIGEDEDVKKKMTLDDVLRVRKTSRPEDVDNSEEVKLTKRKRFYRIGPNGERILVRTEGVNGEDDDQKTSVRKSIHQKPQNDDVEDSEEVKLRKKHREGVEKDEDIKLMKRKTFHDDGDDGNQKTSVRKMVHGQKRQNPEDVDDSEEVKLTKRKRFYKIGPNGERILIRTEGGDVQDDGHQKKPQNDDVGEGEDVKLMKRKKFHQNPEDVDDSEEVKLTKRKRFYKIGPNGERILIRTEGGDVQDDNQKTSIHQKPQNDDVEDSEEVKLMKRKGDFHGEDQKTSIRKSIHQKLQDDQKMSHRNPEDVDGSDEVKLTKRKRFYKIGPNGERILVRTEGVNDEDSDQKTSEDEDVKLLKRKGFHGEDNGQKMSVRKSVHQKAQNDDVEDSEDVKLLKRKGGFHGEGQKTSIRKSVHNSEDVPDSQKTSIQKMSDHQKPQEDVDDSEDVKLLKRKGFHGEDQKTSIQKSSQNPEDVNDSEEVKLTKRKRFYKIDANGERHLVRTEGDNPDDVKLKTFRRKMFGERASDDVEDGEVVKILKKKKKRFYKIGPDGKRTLVRTEGGDSDDVNQGNQMTSRLLGTKKSSHSPTPLEDTSPDQKRPKRVAKRGYFKSGPFEVNQKTSMGRRRESDDDEKNHPIVGSSRPSEKKNTPTSSKAKKMSTYSHDDHVRSEGKSEEDVPEADQ